MPRIIVVVILLCFSLSAIAATTRIANTQPAEGIEVVINTIKTSATAVTAKFEKVTASEMFSRLAREARIVISARDDAVWDDPTVAGSIFSSEWDRSPLWEAVREACASSEMRFETDGSEPGMPRILLSRIPSPAPTFIDGPVLFRADQMTRTASLNYADNSRAGDQVRLTLFVMLEPTLNRHRATLGPVKIEQADDEHGISLATTRPASDRSDSSPTLPDDPRLTVPLDYPQGVGKKLAILRGSVPITIAKESAIVTFNAPFERFKDVKLPVGDNLLTLRSIKINDNGTCQIEVLLTRGQKVTDVAWGVVSKPLGVSNSNALLLSANGPFPRPGSSSNWNDKEARTELHFSERQDKSPATSFRVEMPTAFETLTAKFEFKDISLP